MGRYREMHTFVTVAQTGSLAAAARHLALSPATVMRTIAALEARLHSTLLIRGPRGVRLSPAGEQFAQRCEHILAQTEVAERAAAGLHASPEGQLTLAVPLLIDSQVFTPIAVAYLDAFPQVRLSIQACEGVPRLLKDGIDAAIVVGALPDSSEFALTVGKARPILCASPGYLSRWGRPGTLDELKAHRAVVVSSTGQEAPGRNGAHRALKAAQVLTCTTQRGAIHAVTLGLGVIRCMSYEVHEELASGALEPILSGLAGEDVPVYLSYRHGRRAEARVRSFIDFAAPLLRDHPALR
ncbi:LysR substrate-binding domain-containing protein [Pseudomonas sp. TE3610]